MSKNLKRDMIQRHGIANRFGPVLGLDVRSLALFRMALGVLLLADLAFRGSDFSAMYTDAGFAPAGLVRGLQPYSQWSLHLINGAAGYQAMLFGIAAALALALLVGRCTRLATIGSWILLTSLQVRLPIVLSMPDQLLRMLLFWGMFLPLGRAWSLDARRKPSLVEKVIASPATVALILQLSLVYWLSGWAKWNNDWLKENALGNVLSTGLFTLPLGRTLGEHPDLTRWLSRGVVWFELLGPYLLFIPCKTARWRTLAVAAFMLFHVGIAATVVVGLFSFVAMAGWLAIVPGELWDRLGRLATTAKPQAAGISSISQGHGEMVIWKVFRLARGATCAAALVVVICLHWSQLTKTRLPGATHRWVQRAGQLAALHQRWGMFGEAPPEDCWFAYQAVMKDGRRLDLLSREAGTEGMESVFAWRQLPNDRWRKLHWNLLLDFGRPYRQPLAEYICRRWNETHEDNEQVVRLDMVCHREPFKSAGGEKRYLRTTLAQVVTEAEGGNFAAAVREPDETY